MQYFDDMPDDMTEYEKVLTDMVITQVALRMEGNQQQFEGVEEYFGEDYDRKLKELVAEGMITSAEDDGALTAKGMEYLMDQLSEVAEMEKASSFEKGCAAYELKLTFLFEGLEVWRTIKVPCDITFDDLHTMIQAANSWLNYHVYEFEYTDENDVNHVLNIPQEDGSFAFGMVDMMFKDMGVPYGTDDDDDEEDSREVKLSEVIPTAKDLIYFYDFGDSWEIGISLVGTSTLEDGHVVCTGGEGDAPCEDVGGEWGFKEFLELMDNPSDPEYADMMDWALSQGFEHYDIENINIRLATWRSYSINMPEEESSPNEEYLRIFLQSLDDARVSDRTYNAHASNIEIFLYDFLDDNQGRTMVEGLKLVPEFLGEYYPGLRYRSPSITAYKSMISSIKRFYKCMADYGYIDKMSHRELVDNIKEHQQDWLDRARKRAW